LATSEGSISRVSGQSKPVPKLPCCHVCGTQLVLKGPPSKRRFNPICPNCGAKYQLRCSLCKNLFTPMEYRIRSKNHFCSDEHAVQFGNERRGKQKSAERAARRAIPRQCARKGSILAPGVRQNPELLKDCPVIFTPKRNGQDFCTRECQRIQWWVENYDQLSDKVKQKSAKRWAQLKAARKGRGPQPDDVLGADIERLYEAKKGGKPELHKNGWAEIKDELDANTGVHRTVAAYKMQLKRYRSRSVTS
jgi:predicted RNA-binding Zn-ribbon protein involved in translation (DUF1610 family)